MTTEVTLTEAEKRTRDYDRFGPWVFEIQGPDDVPAAFENAVQLDEGTRAAVKVPIAAERRTVSPQDDLYRDVLVLGPREISAYSLVDGAVEVTRLTYGQVRAVSTLHDLLLGTLTVYGGSTRIDLRFNTVSEREIARVVDTLRAAGREARGNGGAGGADSTGKGYDAVSFDQIEHLYGTLTREERRRHTAIIRAYQPPGRLTRRNPRPLERLLDLIRKERRRPVLILATPEGTVVFHGAPQVTRFGRSNYGYRQTEVWGIPPEEWAVVDDERYVDGQLLNYAVGETRFSYSVQKGFSVHRA